MGQRSEALAAQFEQAIAELAKVVGDTSDQQWKAVCGEEQWTVAATAHHVGAQLPLEMEYITAAAEGRAMPAYTWDDINQRNAQHAQAFRACTRDDVLTLLGDQAPATAAYVRGLSDEQLDRSVAFPLAGGAMVTTEQLILGGVLITHAQAHLQSILAVR